MPLDSHGVCVCVFVIFGTGIACRPRANFQLQLPGQLSPIYWIMFSCLVSHYVIQGVLVIPQSDVHLIKQLQLYKCRPNTVQMPSQCSSNAAQIQLKCNSTVPFPNGFHFGFLSLPNNQLGFCLKFILSIVSCLTLVCQLIDWLQHFVISMKLPGQLAQVNELLSVDVRPCLTVLCESSHKLKLTFE